MVAWTFDEQSIVVLQLDEFWLVLLVQYWTYAYENPEFIFGDHPDIWLIGAFGDVARTIAGH